MVAEPRLNWYNEAPFYFMFSFKHGFGVVLFTCSLFFFFARETTANLSNELSLDVTPASESSSASIPIPPDNNKEFTRDLSRPRPWNIMAIVVQNMLHAGIPAQSIVLLLLLPALATIPAFNRHILGFPTMGIFVPAALSIILLDTTAVPGLILLITVWIISLIARSLLKWVRIMHMPKMALLVLIVGWGILGALYLATSLDFAWTKEISPFAILLAVLLSERFISLLANRSLYEFGYYTTVTVVLSLIGYWLLTDTNVHQLILTYPETVLLLIPINFSIGRYFGLRLSELLRFKKLIFNRYASK